MEIHADIAYWEGKVGADPSDTAAVRQLERFEQELEDVHESRGWGS